MSKLELTWIGALNIWRKQYKGKRYGFGEPNTVEGYKDALARWEAKRTVIDTTERKSKEQNQYAEWGRKLDARSGAVIAPKYPTAPPLGAEHTKETLATVPQVTTAEQLAELGYVNPFNAYGAKQNSKGGKTMAAMIADYIAEQENRYKHGVKFPTAPQSQRISGQRFIAYKYNANLMADVWSSEHLPTDESELAKLMMVFRNRCRTLMNDGKIKPSTYNERMKTMRHFVGWMHDNYLVPSLPRKLGEICGKYAVQSSAVSIDLDIIRKLFNGASDTLKTFISLSLNCGFYVNDIAYLTGANLKGDYLHYDRHKTGVPVRFKLWDVTKQLLAKHTPGEKHLFETVEGDCLLTIETGGKGQRKSKVDNLWYVLCRKLEVKGHSYSHLRDTSTTWIESHNPAVSDMFDAHKDNRMARFYIDPKKLDLDKMFAPLDDATDALGKHYDLKL